MSKVFHGTIIHSAERVRVYRVSSNSETIPPIKGCCQQNKTGWRRHSCLWSYGRDGESNNGCSCKLLRAAVLIYNSHQQRLKREESTLRAESRIFESKSGGEKSKPRAVNRQITFLKSQKASQMENFRWYWIPKESANETSRWLKTGDTMNDLIIM